MADRTVKTKRNRFQRAVVIFLEHGGMLTTTEALQADIHPSTLYSLRDISLSGSTR